MPLNPIFILATFALQNIQRIILKPIHYISIAVALLLSVLLFWKGNIIPPAKPEPPAPMAGAMGNAMPVAADFDSLLTAMKKKLSPQAQAMVYDLETTTRVADKTAAALANENLGKLWQQNKYRGIAAHYFAESGKLDNSEKKLNFAAHLYSEELEDEKNSALRQWLAEGAIDGYTRSLAINPDNDTMRLDLASVYINGTGQTMQGIQELLTVVKHDPANLPANMVLGTMAIESGQYDKAIQRGELILKYHKDNWQARLFMAEAYKEQGKKETAVELLNEAKQIKNDPQFSADIDNYIKTF